MNELEIENTIIKNIDIAKSMGYKLVCGKWADYSNKCGCALGCTLIVNFKEIYSGSNYNNIINLFNVNSYWVDNFTMGFDGEMDPDYPFYTSAYELGARIRELTKPEKWE